jgi:outer membrane lipoprotein-sorting protein
MKVPVFLHITCAAMSLAVALPATAKTTGPALQPLHSFRMHLVDTTPRGTASRDIIFIAPDKLRVDLTGSKMVVVAIAKSVWLREPNGSWQKAEYAPGVDPLADVRTTLDISEQLNGPGVHYAGLATLSGSSVKVYEVATPPRRGFVTPSTRIWIGAQDGYPHQVQQRNGTNVFTATYSAWNQPLSVSGP